MRGLRMAMAGVIALALAGCAATPEEADDDIGVADAREQGTPDGLELPADSTAPFAAALEDGSIAIVTWGSGSCPPRATSFSSSPELLEVVFEPSPLSVCTADLVPATHTFDADRVGTPVPPEAEITLEDGETVVVEVVQQ